MLFACHAPSSIWIDPSLKVLEGDVAQLILLYNTNIVFRQIYTQPNKNGHPLLPCQSCCCAVNSMLVMLSILFFCKFVTLINKIKTVSEKLLTAWQEPTENFGYVCEKAVSFL